MSNLNQIKNEIQNNKETIYNMGLAVLFCGAGVISGAELVDNSFTLALNDIAQSGNVVESLSALAGSLAFTGAAGAAGIGCAAVGAYKTAKLIHNNIIKNSISNHRQ